MRKSQKAKQRFQARYKLCVQSGGHDSQLVNKATGQERCKRCDYCITHN